MIVLVRAWEFLQRIGIVIAGAAIGGVLGFYIPWLFDRDVAGAMWAGIFGVVGLIVGAFLGVIVVRQRFD